MVCDIPPLKIAKKQGNTLSTFPSPNSTFYERDQTEAFAKSLQIFQRKMYYKKKLLE